MEIYKIFAYERNISAIVLYLDFNMAKEFFFNFHRVFIDCLVFNKKKA